MQGGGEMVLKDCLVFFLFCKWRDELEVVVNGLGFDLIVSIQLFCGRPSSQSPCWERMLRET